MKGAVSLHATRSLTWYDLLPMKPVIELPTFTSRDSVVGEGARCALRLPIQNPDAGELIRGAGGARKLRWAASGRGRSGGARIITDWHCDGCPLFLLGIYLKSERENLTRAEINDYKSLCKELADEHQI